jgi:CheY-like chemotaxis protein
MKAPKSTIPIIALTADVTKEDMDKCTALEMDDYLLKPFNETDLLAKIIRLVKETERQ